MRTWISWEKSEGRIRLGTPRCRWEDNIKMNIQAVGLRYGLNWSGSGHGQVVGSCVRGLLEKYPTVFFYANT